MAYYGNAPADVALVVGQDVITTTEIQDATIATADIASDAITATKVDDDGTGFQMGSLGLGTAVSGSHKLTVGGTATFSGDITGTLATASQPNITSVGTLTGLATSGNVGVGSATTSSPSSASRTLRIQHATGSASLVLCGDNDNETAWDVLANTSGQLDIRKNNSSKFLIDSAGTIFQGTTSPTLHSAVRGIVFENGSLLNDVTRGASKSITLAQNVAIDSGNTWAYLSTDEASYYQQYAGNHYFATCASGSAGADATLTSKLTILNAGNVGIGTASPIAKLNIVDASYDYTKGLYIGTGSAGVGLSLWYDNGANTTGYIDSRYDNAGAVIKFRLRANGTPVNALILNGDGNATFAGNIVTESSSIRLTGWSTKNISWGSSDTGHGSNNTGARIEGVVHATSGQAHGALKFYTNSGDSEKHALTLEESGNATFTGYVDGVHTQNVALGGDANATRYLNLGTKDADNFCVVEISAINSNMVGSDRMAYARWIVARGSYSSGGYVATQLDDYGSGFDSSIALNGSDVRIACAYNSHSHSVNCIVRTINGQFTAISAETS